MAEHFQHWHDLISAAAALLNELRQASRDDWDQGGVEDGTITSLDSLVDSTTKLRRLYLDSRASASTSTSTTARPLSLEVLPASPASRCSRAEDTDGECAEPRQGSSIQQQADDPHLEAHDSRSSAHARFDSAQNLQGAPRGARRDMRWTSLPSPPEDPRRHHIGKRRKMTDSGAAPAPNKRVGLQRMISSNRDDVSSLQSKLETHDRLCRFPDLGSSDVLPSAKMLRLVAAVQGGPAIRQFCTLIARSRSRATDAGLLRIRAEGVERALHLSRSLEMISGRSDYDSYLVRVAQMHMAMAVDGLDASKTGRLRADSKLIKEAMDRFGVSDKDRPKFHWHLKRGRQWFRLCGRCTGLLALVPFRSQEPYQVGTNDYLCMRPDELDEFTRLGSQPFLEGILRAAERFQESVTGTKTDTDFMWEKEHPNLHEWDRFIPEDELASLIQPVPSCDENIFDPTSYPDWSSNPLKIPMSERQCDLCENESCSCSRDVLLPASKRVRIKTFHPEGSGIQATAAREGDIAYRKGELIGQICGWLAPPGTFGGELSSRSSRSADENKSGDECVCSNRCDRAMDIGDVH